MRRRWLLAATASSALAMGIGVALWREAHRSGSAAGAAALFAATYTDADGIARPLAQWRGTLLVVNFWATWCAPCVEEMPALDRVRDEFGAHGVEVIGIGIDSADRIRAFRDKLGIGLPLLVAGSDGSELARTLGNLAGVLPYTVLVARSGAIEQRHVGQIRPEQLRAWLNAQLAAGG